MDCGNLAGPGEYFTGDVDEVRIWNRTLCQGEINNNRTAQIILPQTNLMAYYQFNQGVASAANPGVNTLIPLTGPTGTLAPAITLSGAASNWVAPGGVVSGSSASAFVPAVLSVSGPTLICSGNTAVLTATSASSGLNYSWNTGATTNSISY